MKKLKSFFFWPNLWVRNPITVTRFLFLMWLESRAPNKWVVLVEVDDNGEITRSSSWPEPTNMETAMRRAKMENFRWIVCCAGKDEGTCLENPEWLPQQA